MNWIILLVVVLTLTSRAAHSQPANETVVPPDIKLSSQLRDLKIDLATARTSHDFVTLRINTLEPIPIKLMYLADSTQIDFNVISHNAIVFGGEMNTWRRACLGECNTWLFRRAAYKIDGDGLTPSSLQFPGRGKHFVLDIEPRSVALRAIAYVTLAVGAQLAAVGFTSLGLFLMDQKNQVARDLSISGHAVGITLMLVSMPMFLFSKTKYRLDRAD